MAKPRIYADFHNTDAQGRVRLNCVGTIEDLSRQHVELRDGLAITIYADDLDRSGQLDELLAEGVVAFSQEEHCWVAAIDWAAIRHASDEKALSGNGAALLPEQSPPQMSPVQGGGD